MTFRLTIILFTTSLALTAILSWIFAFQNSQQLNQQQINNTSKYAHILQHQLNHYFSKQTFLESNDSLEKIFTRYNKLLEAQIILVNQFDRILAHPREEYINQFLPSASPLSSIIHNYPEGYPTRTATKNNNIFSNNIFTKIINKWSSNNNQPSPPTNQLIVSRPINSYPIKSFIILNQPMQTPWGLLTSHLTFLSGIFICGFMILWLCVFLCLKPFTQASRFILRALTLLNKTEKRDALCQLTHSQNPYLKSIRPQLTPLLSTEKSPSFSNTNTISFSNVLQQVIQQSEMRYPTVHIQTHLTADIPLPIFADSLFQALWELIKNAAEAVHTVTKTNNPPDSFKTETIKNNPYQITIRTFKKDDWFYCEVIDQGPGMDSNTITNACKPYFSTKPSYIGMGLTLVEKALSRLGGIVHFHSPDKTGLTVTMLIPLDYIDHVQTIKSASQKHFIYKESQSGTSSLTGETIST